LQCRRKFVVIECPAACPLLRIDQNELSPAASQFVLIPKLRSTIEPMRRNPPLINSRTTSTPLGHRWSGGHAPGRDGEYHGET
jgi:hypothetical protein